MTHSGVQNWETKQLGNKLGNHIWEWETVFKHTDKYYYTYTTNLNYRVQQNNKQSMG